jgi:hypothetical protein
MSMPALDQVTWSGFVDALSVYKERFSGKSGQDLAYVRCLMALEGLSMPERAAHAADIVAFLNSWAARVSRNETPSMLGGWISEQADPLQRVAELTIDDDLLSSHIEEIAALYASLMTTGRAAVRNWSDAANSKTLHQLVPAVFVMWDKKIMRSAGDYGEFMREMHGLARRLIQDSPYPADRIEIELQSTLRYATRKPLAKYLDEFNVVRVDQSDRSAPGPSVS